MRSNINAVRNHVAALRLALLSCSPGEIERSLPGLVEAAGYLSQVEHELRSQPDRGTERHPGLREDILALRHDLGMVGRLLQNGAAFYQGWARVLGAASGGYTPTGAAEPVQTPSAISMEG